MHLRELERELDMPLGTLEHHLKKLEEMKKVVTRAHGRYKSYYPKNHIDRTDKDYLYFLHQETPRRVTLALASVPEQGMLSQELADELGLAASTISHHAKKLVEGGLVTKEREGSRVRFHLTDPDRVKRLMLEYPGSFLASFGDWFRLAWEKDGRDGRAPDGDPEPTPSSSETPSGKAS